LIDADVLLEIRVFQSRQQSALLHLLAFLDGQIHNAPLHLEADQAFVGFNVAGEREIGHGRRLPGQPWVKIYARGNGRGQQDYDGNQSLHRFKPRIRRSQLRRASNAPY
jgi:hypothetical protein